MSQVDSRLASRTASVAGPSEASNELRKASSSAAKTSESSTAGRHREAKQSDDGQEDVEANQREANLSVDQTATATGKSNSNAKKRQTSSLESPGKKPAGEQDDPEEAEDAGSAKPAAADPDAPSGLLLTVSSLSFILNHSLRQFLLLEASLAREHVERSFDLTMT